MLDVKHLMIWEWSVQEGHMANEAIALKFNFELTMDIFVRILCDLQGQVNTHYFSFAWRRIPLEEWVTNPLYFWNVSNITIHEKGYTFLHKNPPTYETGKVFTALSTSMYRKGWLFNPAQKKHLSRPLLCHTTALLCI